MMKMKFIPYFVNLQKTNPLCGQQLIHIKSTKNVRGGTIVRPSLEHQSIKDYGNGIMLQSSPGIANILIFKSKANSVLQIQELKDEYNANIDSVAKKKFPK